MPRLARLDTPGLIHHVIIRGIERVARHQNRLLRMGISIQPCSFLIQIRRGRPPHTNEKVADRVCCNV